MPASPKLHLDSNPLESVSTNPLVQDLSFFFPAHNEEANVEPMVMTPAEFQNFIAGDVDKWAKVIRYAAIKAE